MGTNFDLVRKLPGRMARRVRNDQATAILFVFGAMLTVLTCAVLLADRFGFGGAKIVSTFVTRRTAQEVGACIAELPAEGARGVLIDVSDSGTERLVHVSTKGRIAVPRRLIADLETCAKS